MADLNNVEYDNIRAEYEAAQPVAIVLENQTELSQTTAEGGGSANDFNQGLN